MATNFFELATTLKKFRSEVAIRKKINFTLCTGLNFFDTIFSLLVKCEDPFHFHFLMRRSHMRFDL